MGFDGPVALNMLAIEQGMRDFNVDDDEKILFSSQVRKIALVIFNAQKEEREENRKNK